MSAKDSIAIQTCELSEEEFNEFLVLYSIPSSYHVILPKSNQTVLDAPLGYVGLYTHSFSLANLRLPLTKFFCEVLEYFQVYISRLNPFGYAKLTTFVVMCKAYGCEPTVKLFRGLFNLCQACKWLTFDKRPKKHIPHLFLNVITRIEGWKERFFYVQNSIVPAKYPQLLLEQNKYDSKSYKDKLPLILRRTPCSNALVVILRAFVFFLIPSFFGWPPIFEGTWPATTCYLKIAFRNFVYAEDEEDLSFLPNEPSPSFGIGSLFVLVNIEPLMTDEDPILQPTEATTDFGGSPKHELFVPPIKRKLAPGSLTAHATHAKTFALKDDVSFLTISDEDEGTFNVPELKDAPFLPPFVEFKKNDHRIVVKRKKSTISRLPLDKDEFEVVEGLKRRNLRDVVKQRVQRLRRIDRVFDGAFGGVEDKEVVVGEGVVVTSSSLEMLTNNCLGWIMVSLIFLEGLKEEA
ncbi:hypothetical protein Tco_1088117 [Tanacetum coccineum]